MDIFTQGIETERMYLLPLHEKYVEEIFREFDEEVTRYMAPIPSTEIQGTRNACQSMIAKMQNKERIVLIGVKKDTGEFVGSFDILGLGSLYLEAGLWVKKSFHGNGYGREGMLTLIQWVKSHIDFEYILYPVDKDNISSRKIAEFAGGVLDKDEYGKEIVMRKKTQNPEKVLNTVHYKIYKNHE